MLNFQVTLPKDIKEAARVEKARQFEEQRKARIFNPRQRLFGIDCDALKVQMEEKRIREEEERRIEEAYVQKQMRDAEISKRLENQIEQNRRRLGEEINEFRVAYQQPRDRREFDLYDPDALKKSLPCRLLDDDPRLTISSAQRFEGEDMATAERAAKQREQQRAWLEQQMLERCRADRERAEAERAYHEAVQARDRRALALDELERQSRRQLERAAARFNQALAAEQATKKRMEELRGTEDAQAEIYNAVTSDLLTENPNLRQSGLGPGRINTACYKGMTDEEKEEIRQTNFRIIRENKLRKEEEAQREKEWLKVTEGIARTVALKDREINKKQREIDSEVKERNRILDCEKKKNQEYLEKVVYTNRPTAAYFEQFNTTSR